MKKIIIEFISCFLENSKNVLFINTKFGERKQELDLFGLNDINTKNQPVFFLDYFKKSDPNKYDLIVAELPFSLKGTRNNDFKFSIPENWEMLYWLTSKLGSSGILLVGVESMFGVSKKSKNFIHTISGKNIFLQSLIESPKKIHFPHTNIQPSIAVFSKCSNQNKFFIASLDENEAIEELFENLSKRKANGNLVEGDIVEIEDFKGFLNYRINKEIEALQSQFKEFEKKYLGDIAIEINITKTKFTEDKNNSYIYISKVGKLSVFNDLDSLDKKQHNFFQVKLKNKIADPVYLEYYFKSDLGQLSLESLMTGTIVKNINKVSLKDIIIPLPDIKTQKEIIKSYELISQTYNVINYLEKDLYLNPKGSRGLINRLTETLSVLNELSKEDKVLHYIRQGEGLKVEFKETFITDKKTKEKRKELADASLKNIVGFLNKDGGVLLIGIADDGEIYGIENDNYQSNDKYLLYFKDKLKTAIGGEFFDLVEYEIIDINEKKILCVECKPSKKPVYMHGKDFYIRTSPAAEKLEGPKLVEYIGTHFKNLK